MLRNLIVQLFVLFSVCPFLAYGEAAGRPCGLSGDLNIRIRDCSTKIKNVSLLTRTQDGKEIYIDWDSALIWGDRLPQHMLFRDGVKFCSEQFSEIAEIPARFWRLPRVEEFLEAENRGLRSILPNMNAIFWTSTPVYQSFRDVWIFDGSNATVAVAYTPSPEMLINPNYFYVRCVAKVILKK